MAKRGEKLPWRVRYEWDNGVKGSTNFHSEDTARLVFDQVLAQAERTNRSVTVWLELNGEPVAITALRVTVGGVYKLIQRRWPKTKQITELGPALDDDQPAPLTD